MQLFTSSNLMGIMHRTDWLPPYEVAHLPVMKIFPYMRLLQWNDCQPKKPDVIMYLKRGSFGFGNRKCIGFFSFNVEKQYIY